MFCCMLAPWGGGRETFFVLQRQQRQAQNGAVRRGTGNRLLMAQHFQTSQSPWHPRYP